MSNEEDIQRKGKMLISRSKGKNVCVCVCVCMHVCAHTCMLGVQEGLIRYKLQDSYILFVNTRYLQWNHSANTHRSQKLA